MNILLLGSGGREHAFAHKISGSPLCEKLYIAPGNAGTSQHGTNIDISVSDFPKIAAFSLEKHISMVIVGPEVPLVEGIVDYFEARPELSHIQVVGPAAKAAQLEGSKSFAKAFMQKYNIPTAGYREFTRETLNEALEYIGTQSTPIVLKADGLAAGKGVLICESKEDAKKECRSMLEGKFGTAGDVVVIEEFLDGIEFSSFVLTDGKDYVLLPEAKDYKRIGEGDKGLNTGGMGAVSPVPFVDETMREKLIKRVVEPTIRGIAEEGMNYKGFVFVGLMVVNSDPYVIEYNCRMGDPETEAVFPRIQNDLLLLLTSLFNGKLSAQRINIDSRFAATVMLVSGGYPEAYEKGKLISGIEEIEGSTVFHAGTRSQNDDVLTAGGRVLAVTSLQEDMQAALQTSQKNASKIQFDGKYFRKDIGFDL